MSITLSLRFSQVLQPPGFGERIKNVMLVFYFLLNDKTLTFKNTHMASANKKSLGITLVPEFYFLIPTQH